MKKVIVRTIINAIAVALAAKFIPGISYTGGAIGLLAVTLFLGVINLFIKPVITFLSLPIKLLTLGIFSLIINGGMLYLTSLLLENFTIGDAWFPGIELGPVIIEPLFIPFWGIAIIGALFISLVSGFLTWLVE